MRASSAHILLVAVVFTVGCSSDTTRPGIEDSGLLDAVDGGSDVADASPPDVGPREPSWASVVAITSGNTCGILDNGAVRCWGREHSTTWGEPLYLGPPNADSSAFGVPMADVAGRPGMMCGASRDDEVHCWGDEALPQPGMGPLDVVPDVFGEPGRGVTVSARTACWLESDGLGRCRTRPDPDSTALSEAAIPADLRFSQIALGLRFGCGLELETRAVTCWGPDADRVVGIEPVGEFVDLAVMIDTACAIDTEQRLHCWGTRAWIPSELGVQEPATDVEARGTSWCVRVASSGQWVCSSSSVSGQVLVSNTPDRADIEDVSVSSTHACGRSSDGWLCWGSNDDDQLTIPDPRSLE